MSPEPHEIETALDGARLAGSLPTITEEVTRMKTTVENRIYAAIRDGRLTPDMAMNAWHEMQAYSRFFNNVRSRVKVGEEVGVKIAPHMNY